MSSKRKISFAFKITTIVCCLTGIVLNLIRTKEIATMLSYYTTQSNILVLILYLISIIMLCVNSKADDTKAYHFVKGTALVTIMLTFFVYMFSLSPIYFVMDSSASSSANVLRISNILVHMLTPCMVLIDYLVFEKKGFLRKKYIPFWCIYPIFYLIYTYIYSNCGGKFYSKKYAYFFLDIEKLGYPTVMFYILILTLFFVFLCYLFIALDKFLAKKNK